MFNDSCDLSNKLITDFIWQETKDTPLQLENVNIQNLTFNNIYIDILFTIEGKCLSFTY